MVPQLSAAGYASTYFPDQPIELSFRQQGSRFGEIGERREEGERFNV